VWNMQRKWISGSKLLKQWDIEKRDLFEYIKEGLQPYDELYNLKVSPDDNEKSEKLKNMKNELIGYDIVHTDYGEMEYDEKGNIHHIETVTYTYKEIHIDEYESLKTEISKLESDLNNVNYSWGGYKLPDNTNAAISILNNLVHSFIHSFILFIRRHYGTSKRAGSKQKHR
jgi:hypothetical protein